MRVAPIWLGKQAKGYYTRLAKRLPELTLTQKELLAVLADAWETLQAAKDECQKAKSFLQVTTKGDTIPHASYRVYQSAQATYLRTWGMFQRSLGSLTTPESDDELDNLLEQGEENE